MNKKLKKLLFPVLEHIEKETEKLRETNKELQRVLEKLSKYPKTVHNYRSNQDYVWLGLGYGDREVEYKGYKRMKLETTPLSVIDGQLAFTNMNTITFPMSKSGTVYCPHKVNKAFVYLFEDSAKPVKTIPLTNWIDVSSKVIPEFYEGHILFAADEL